MGEMNGTLLQVGDFSWMVHPNLGSNHLVLLQVEMVDLGKAVVVYLVQLLLSLQVVHVVVVVVLQGT